MKSNDGTAWLPKAHRQELWTCQYSSPMPLTTHPARYDTRIPNVITNWFSETMRPRALAGQLVALEDVVGVEVGDGPTLVVQARNPRRFYRALTRLVLEEDYAVAHLEPLDDSAHAILGYLLGGARR